MGNYFSNLFIRQGRQTTADTIGSTLIEHFSARGIHPCEADKADLSVLLDMSHGTWGAVYCEECGYEDLLALAPRMSEQCHADVLTCACFDSDYMFLNLYNTESATDAFINIGKSDEIKPPRRTTLAAWRTHVKDFDAFKQAAKQPYVCAEDFLSCVQEQLSLPDQNSLDQGAAITLYFSVPQEQKPEPTRLCTDGSSMLPCQPGKEKYLSVSNKGGGSRGLCIMFVGSYVENDEITFDNVELCYQDARGERISRTLTFTKTVLDGGLHALVAKLPDFKISAAPSPKLPPKALMKKQVAGSIVVRFTPHGNLRKFLDITVVFLPYSNPTQGKCVWRVWKGYKTKAAYIDAHNHDQAQHSKMYGVPQYLIDPDMYDLD